MPKLVRAIATGFHGQLREPGTPNAQFEIADDEELGTWMELVSAPKKAKAEAAKAAAEKPADPVSPSPISPQLAAAGGLPEEGQYQAKHIAAGNWKVFDSKSGNEEPVGPLFKKADHGDDKEASRSAAEAEAVRLNAGGIPAPVIETEQLDEDGKELPDA